MERRNILKSIGSAPLAVLAPSLFASVAEAAAQPQWDRILIMVELKGGNDGLNTVVPYSNNSYYQYRPNIAIAKDNVLQMDENFGLHPSLTGMHNSFKKKELAVALGCGYHKPNRSHFRSIDIWHTAANSDQVVGEGWIARMFAKNPPPESFMADGVILGQGDAGPLKSHNPKIRSIIMRNPDEFVEKGQDAKESKRSSKKGALAHILGVERDLAVAVETLKKKMAEGPELETEFPNTNLGRQMKIVADLVSSKVPLACVKVQIGGFDTHAGQVNRHAQLMTQLDGALSSFRRAMLELGKWQQVLVMTYSEFGRRVKENGSAGTDHGTAAPHFMMGGRVKGGIYGEHPKLDGLSKGDLEYTMDYRCLYETVSQNWWGLGSNFADLKTKVKALDCIS